MRRRQSIRTNRTAKQSKRPIRAQEGSKYTASFSILYTAEYEDIEDGYFAETLDELPKHIVSDIDQLKSTLGLSSLDFNYAYEHGGDFIVELSSYGIPFKDIASIASRYRDDEDYVELKEGGYAFFHGVMTSSGEVVHRIGDIHKATESKSARRARRPISRLTAQRRINARKRFASFRRRFAYSDATLIFKVIYDYEDVENGLGFMFTGHLGPYIEDLAPQVEKDAQALQDTLNIRLHADTTPVNYTEDYVEYDIVSDDYLSEKYINSLNLESLYGRIPNGFGTLDRVMVMGGGMSGEYQGEDFTQYNELYGRNAARERKRSAYGPDGNVKVTVRISFPELESMGISWTPDGDTNQLVDQIYDSGIVSDIGQALTLNTSSGYDDGFEDPVSPSTISGDFIEFEYVSWNSYNKEDILDDSWEEDWLKQLYGQVKGSPVGTVTSIKINEGDRGEYEWSEVNEGASVFANKIALRRSIMASRRLRVRGSGLGGHVIYKVVVDKPKGYGTLVQTTNLTKAKDVFSEYIELVTGGFGTEIPYPVTLLEDDEVVDSWSPEADLDVDDMYEGDIDDIGFDVYSRRRRPQRRALRRPVRRPAPRRAMQRGRIVDSFAQPRRMKSYEELVAQSPADELLANIGDEEMWTANNELRRRRRRGPSKRSVKLNEDWTDAGYNRSIEAESPEELYHLVRSFGTEDDYDWSSSAPRQPGQYTQEEKEMGVTAADKTTEDYWGEYFGDYGKKWVENDVTRGVWKNFKDPKKKESMKRESELRRKARMRARMVNLRRRRAQEMDPMAEMPPAPQEPQQAPAQAPAQSPQKSTGRPPAPGGVPGAGAPPVQTAQPNPASGDESLKALGWTPEDIQLMTPDQKQKIIQISLNKPGSQVGQPANVPVRPLDQGQPPKKNPTGIPTGEVPQPQAPQAPQQAPQAPQQEMAPMARNRSRRSLSDRMKASRAFRMLAQELAPQQAPAPAPQQTPAPQPAPQAQSAPQQGQPAPAKQKIDPSKGVDDSSPEAQVFSLYQQVLAQEVEAATPTEVQAKKAQELMRRALNDLGMTPSDLKKLFGKDNLMSLFPN
jgi:hypothetical protein